MWLRKPSEGSHRVTFPHIGPGDEPYRSSVEIRAGDLVLRRPCSADLDAVIDACADPDIRRFVPLVPVPYGMKDAKVWLDSVDRAWKESEERTFTIVDSNAHPALQGVVTVRLREGGTVGYWLAPWARGRGVMTESVRAVVDWARREHGVKRLFLTAHPDNAASQRVAERVGFRRIGMTEHEPPFLDGTTSAVLFELG